MKIVIDITAEDFEKVKCGRGAVSMMRKAIIHGTPLPKGHRSLKDADTIRKTISESIEECKKWADEVNFNLSAIATILGDISISLAVLTDKSEREETIKEALKFLVSKQQVQGSLGYAGNDNGYEVSWDEVLKWIDAYNMTITNKYKTESEE